MKIQSKWAIGIYSGSSPFIVNPTNVKNPVLTAKDVTDTKAEFVADPFMVKENNDYYMFFEVFNSRTGHGDIGLATSSNALNWSYRQIILDEPFHLSHPFVFKWDNEYYMIPESYCTYSVRLYKSIVFPTEWKFINILLSGNDFMDSTIFRYSEKWWIITAIHSKKSDTLCLYYSNDFMGPWTEHPLSPVIKGDASRARPGGRVLIFNGRIIRFGQNNIPKYGHQLRAFELDLLTTKDYIEHEIEESPILKAKGKGWNADGMHNIDLIQIDKDKWIACVDGYKKGWLFGWRY